MQILHADTSDTPFQNLSHSILRGPNIITQFQQPEYCAGDKMSFQNGGGMAPAAPTRSIVGLLYVVDLKFNWILSIWSSDMR